MNELTFPLWIVTQRRGVVSLPVEPEGMPGYIAAFTRAEKAATFMSERGETEWENKLVSRSTFTSLMEELRVMVAVRGLCLDPARNTMGTPITFEEIDKRIRFTEPHEKS
jgi:hypothetical protein